MSKPSDPAAFRAGATTVYRIFCAGLVAAGIAAAWVGWRFGAWVGLAIGIIAGAVVAFVGWAAATLMWAMTQDGA